MINSECAAMINEHLPREIKASSAYLRMAMDANSLGFFGVSDYFAKASLEEQEHLRKFITFLNDYDQPFTVPAVDAIDQRTADIRGMFVAALAMEQEVSASINKIADCADDEGHDFQTFEFLRWFLEEQTKSEIELRNIIYRYDMSVGNMPAFDEYVGELNG